MAEKPTIVEIDIAKEQVRIKNAFLDFYRYRGYLTLTSTNILPENDESVLFTGATITPLKKFLIEGIAPPGICMVQKCLRTKRLNEMTNMSKIPDWTHYFTMCGILSAPERLEEVSEEAYELLIKKLGINPNNLLLEASSADSDLLRFWISNGVQAKVDQKQQTYYQWTYGRAILNFSHQI